jgi:hypothetical protein
MLTLPLLFLACTEYAVHSKGGPTVGADTEVPEEDSPLPEDSAPPDETADPIDTSSQGGEDSEPPETGIPEETGEPPVLEVCDGLDNDGDGEIDEGFDGDTDGTADCLETSHSVEFTLAADDCWEAWADGVSLGSYCGWSTATTHSLLMDTGPHVIAVYARDDALAIAGFLAEVKVDGATEVLTGDAAWVGQPSWPADPTWIELAFDDSAWSTQPNCDPSEVSSWWGSEPAALRGVGAQWIWPRRCTDLGEGAFRLRLELP